jgi:hypothetical protein
VDTTNAISSDFTITANSTIHLYDEKRTDGDSDFIVQGTLRGTGI